MSDKIGSQKALDKRIWDLHQQALEEGLKFETSVGRARRRYLRKLKRAEKEREEDERDD